MKKLAELFPEEVMVGGGGRKKMLRHAYENYDTLVELVGTIRAACEKGRDYLATPKSKKTQTKEYVIFDVLQSALTTVEEFEQGEPK